MARASRFERGSDRALAKGWEAGGVGERGSRISAAGGPGTGIAGYRAGQELEWATRGDLVAGARAETRLFEWRRRGASGRRRDGEFAARLAALANAGRLFCAGCGRNHGIDDSKGRPAFLGRAGALSRGGAGECDGVAGRDSRPRRAGGVRRGARKIRFIRRKTNNYRRKWQ